MAGNPPGHQVSFACGWPVVDNQGVAGALAGEAGGDRMPRWFGFWAAALMGAVSAMETVAASPPASAADSMQFEEQVRPLLLRHCMACHIGAKPRGNLSLDALKPDFTDAASHARWASVMARVQSGEMPPKDKPRLPPGEIQTLTHWLALRVAAADAAALATQGRVVLRRLNRTEYENTVNDLLGIQANLKGQLPQDGSADGFDNAGAMHHTSSFLMEKYLEAAETALNLAIANRPKPPTLIKKRYSIKDVVLEIAKSSGSLQLIAGQVADLEGEGKKISRAQLRYIHERKTSALLACSVRLGGMSANCTPAQLDALTDFGYNVGLAFQVVDDLLDATGDEAKMGKRVGKDSGLGKWTYPGLIGVESSRAHARTLADSAISALNIFDERADRLRALAHQIVERDH